MHSNSIVVASFFSLERQFHGHHLIVTLTDKVPSDQLITCAKLNPTRACTTGATSMVNVSAPTSNEDGVPATQRTTKQHIPKSTSQKTCTSATASIATSIFPYRTNSISVMGAKRSSVFIANNFTKRSGPATMQPWQQQNIVDKKFPVPAPTCRPKCGKGTNLISEETVILLPKSVCK